MTRRLYRFPHPPQRQVVSRLHEFTSKTSDVPKSFRSLCAQLPLLTATLDRIQTQARTGQLPSHVISALKTLIDGTLTQVSIVQTFLSNILPPTDAKKLERALQVLRSLAKEDKVCQASEKIHKSIDVLVLHQTTLHVDIGYHILEELSKLNLSPPASVKSFGVCLGQAPQIEPDALKGRREELQQLRDQLIPANHPHRQCIVSIVGVGGMGKTQLSMAHVRECGEDYSSVFWVSAKDETSLRQQLAALSIPIFPGSAGLTIQSGDDEKVAIERVRRWLSEPGNDQWLLIFDNYDDPRLPGLRSPTGYDIRPFFPTRSQGSILITTRSTKLVFSKHLHLHKLEDVSTSMAILSQRSGRDLSNGKE
jgi:N-terminal domain on NACHT_NTPase and P-loop NTPases